jgi:hypothetical protein
VPEHEVTALEPLRGGASQEADSTTPDAEAIIVELSLRQAVSAAQFAASRQGVAYPRPPGTSLTPCRSMPLGRQYAQKASALETVASKLVGKLILFVLAQRYLKIRFLNWEERHEEVA